MKKVQNKKFDGSKNKKVEKTSSKNISYQPKIYNFNIIALAGFIIPLILLVFSYDYFGSFFEMNDDPRYVMAMKGFASPVPYNNFVSVYIFTSDLYIWLYKQALQIPWYGLSMFILLWGALFNIFIAIYLIACKRINLTGIILIFLALYFLVFFQNVYWINFTRPSIIGTSSFILLLAALYLNHDVFVKNKWIIIVSGLVYILSHITRLDAGYLGFIFSVTAATLIVSYHKNISPFLLRYILPVFIFILAIKFIDVISQKDNPRNKDFLEKTEMIRQIIDYRNTSGYIPKDIKDTLTWNALMNARYCSDDNVISIEYLKKLSNESPLLQSGNMNKMDIEFGAFTKSLKEDNKIARNLNISFIIILLLWAIVTKGKNIGKFIKFFLLQLFFMSIIAGMSYYMKLPSRIYNPLLVLLTISNTLIFISLFYFKERKYYYLSFLILISILVAFPGYSKANKKYISDYEKYGRINHGIINDMNTFQNTIFIPTNVRSWEMHNGTDPIKEINFKNNNCYVYLSIELSLAPETQDQLMDKFGTFDHAELFKKISTMNNVIFISTDSYNNFLRGYYHYLYNQDYYFEKIRNERPPFYQNTGLDYYRLKKF